MEYELILKVFYWGGIALLLLAALVALVSLMVNAVIGCLIMVFVLRTRRSVGTNRITRLVLAFKAASNPERFKHMFPWLEKDMDDILYEPATPEYQKLLSNVIRQEAFDMRTYPVEDWEDEWAMIRAIFNNIRHEYEEEKRRLRK